jgi:hypothetical protein
MASMCSAMIAVPTGAALSPVPDDPQESLPAARQPIGVEPGDRSPDDESVVLGVPQLPDLVSSSDSVRFGAVTGSANVLASSLTSVGAVAPSRLIASWNGTQYSVRPV